MSGYRHSPAPTDHAQRFIAWCGENIAQWDDSFISVARHFGTKNKWWKKNFTWRKHHKSLSCAHWSVCTKSQWQQARKLFLRRAMP